MNLLSLDNICPILELLMGYYKFVSMIQPSKINVKVEGSFIYL